MKIKFCGFTRKKDALEAERLNVEYLGFNFFRGSKRYIEPSEARAIKDELRGKSKTVALFVNHSRQAIEQAIKVFEPDLIQFHGDEDDELIREFARRFRVIQAIRVGVGREFSEPVVDDVLIDAYSEEHFGGTGLSVDLSLIPKEQLQGKRLFLAGGLTPENLASVLGRIQPEAIDVAGGIESSPGVKDLSKMREFVEVARESVNE